MNSGRAAHDLSRQTLSGGIAPHWQRRAALGSAFRICVALKEAEIERWREWQSAGGILR